MHCKKYGSSTIRTLLKKRTLGFFRTREYSDPSCSSNMSKVGGDTCTSSTHKVPIKPGLASQKKKDKDRRRQRSSLLFGGQN